MYLQTDASEFGIGAYMFQLEADGVTHRPIEFLSKTLSATQRRWGIPDKEAYAIFYALKKWEHHLRDSEFILQTDHVNLTYVNYEGTAKVKRWKMLIQEYRFKIEYLPGPLNVVADGMSRCCAKESLNDTPDITEIEFLEFLESTTDGGEESHIDLLEEDELHMLEELFLEELFPLFREEVPIPDHIRGAIGEVHNSSVGHCGVRRTEARLK